MRNTRPLDLSCGLLFAAVISVVLLQLGCDEQKEETPTRGSLHVLSSVSQGAIMKRQVEEFSSLYRAAKVTLGITSTREAIVQLLNDSVRFICIDRALNSEELAVVDRAKLDIGHLHVAQDALAFIVHKDNPLTDMGQSTLHGIITGRISDWKDVENSNTSGKIEVACTGRNSGTYELLTRQFFPMRSDIPLSFLADSQRATVDFVASRKRGFGVVSAAAVRDTGLQIGILDVEAVDSATGALSFVKLHQANIFQGKYPFNYPVYVYFAAKRMGLPNGFATFMASHPGQKIFLNAGLAPKQQPVRLVQLREE